MPSGGLGRVTSWTDAREALTDVHQLVHSELPLIPLWQITNHYAHSENLQGITAKPITLYQNIESWRISR